MTIINFYKKLSSILTDTREKFLSQTEAEKQLEILLEEAKKSDIKVNISKEILDPIFLMRLDDENSFREDDDDGDFSFISDYQSSY